VPIANISEVWTERTYTPSVIHVSVSGCTVKQAIYRCYNSWRATFRYCQMCWLLFSFFDGLVSVPRLLVSVSVSMFLVSVLRPSERHWDQTGTVAKNANLINQTRIRWVTCAHSVSQRSYTSKLTVSVSVSRRRLRSSSIDQLIVPSHRLSTVGARAFPVAGAYIWNGLPADVTFAPSLPVFRQRLKTVLFRRSYPSICVIW